MPTTVLGTETYDNQKNFAKIVFDELKDIEHTGLMLDQQLHTIELVCCCDWKASALIEGNQIPTSLRTTEVGIWIQCMF